MYFYNFSFSFLFNATALKFIRPNSESLETVNILRKWVECFIIGVQMGGMSKWRKMGGSFGQDLMGSIPFNLFTMGIESLGKPNLEIF